MSKNSYTYPGAKDAPAAVAAVLATLCRPATGDVADGRDAQRAELLPGLEKNLAAALALQPDEAVEIAFDCDHNDHYTLRRPNWLFHAILGITGSGKNVTPFGFDATKKAVGLKRVGGAYVLTMWNDLVIFGGEVVWRKL